MHPPSLVVHLEAPLTAYRNPDVPAREVVVMALRCDTPHWPGLAVAWLEQGLPMNVEIAGLLDAVTSRSRRPQRLRRRAAALLGAWRAAG